MIRGWMESLGPMTAAELAAQLALSRTTKSQALALAGRPGAGLSGAFYRSPQAPVRSSGAIAASSPAFIASPWAVCGAKSSLFPRSISIASFARWQHLRQAANLHGADGTLQIVRQLQGYEIPALAWEPDVPPAHRGIRSGVSRRTLPLGRSGLGASFAASGIRGSRTAACAPRASRRFRSFCAKMRTG